MEQPQNECTTEEKSSGNRKRRYKPDSKTYHTKRFHYYFPDDPRTSWVPRNFQGGWGPSTPTNMPIWAREMGAKELYSPPKVCILALAMMIAGIPTVRVPGLSDVDMIMAAQKFIRENSQV
ncbi:spermatogenesis-associated 25 [Pelobates cultripes]|uniref:Spermatogenesis-associated 25 n=1 Tax=Pelobates cultripes TaxID=61616 RepID=A0AAD1SLD0_PELCU|nr:spermatogenesis-associated 25 [Pelobates cultripes]